MKMSEQGKIAPTYGESNFLHFTHAQIYAYGCIRKVEAGGYDHAEDDNVRRQTIIP